MRIPGLRPSNPIAYCVWQCEKNLPDFEFAPAKTFYDAVGTTQKLFWRYVRGEEDPGMGLVQKVCSYFGHNYLDVLHFVEETETALTAKAA